jgi:hypothetical protein
MAVIARCNSAPRISSAPAGWGQSNVTGMHPVL